MQISKTIFLIFNILFLISCDNEKEGSQNNLRLDNYKYVFSTEEKTLDYLTEDTQSIIIKIEGSLLYNAVNKVVGRQRKGRKCFYHNDKVQREEVHFQMKTILDYFDLSIDEVAADYRFLPTGQLLVYIPPNSKVFRMTLREKFHGIVPLYYHSARKSKKCRRYYEDGTAATRISKTKTGEVQRFIRIKYQLSIQPSSLR